MFDFSRLFEADRDVAAQYLGSLYREPDLVIRPDDQEYIYRWHLVPRNREANVYFHIQVASDPERPLHDHPWDNVSVILAGGYEEIMVKGVGFAEPQRYTRTPGDVIFRRAAWAHRLVLPSSVPYSMTLFTTGPKVKEWGFWVDGAWVPYDELTETKEGVSTWKT